MGSPLRVSHGTRIRNDALGGIGVLFHSIRLILPLDSRKTPSWPPCFAKSSCNSPQVPRGLPQSLHLISVASMASAGMRSRIVPQ